MRTRDNKGYFNEVMDHVLRWLLQRVKGEASVCLISSELCTYLHSKNNSDVE